MGKLQKIQLSPVQNGIVREAAVDESLSPPNTAQFLLNLHCDRIGALTLRPGLTLLGSQVESGQNVLGMANYRNNSGSTKRLLVKINTNIYDYDGNSWNSVRSGLTATSKARFTNLIDLTYMVNGTNNEVLRTYDGSTFGSSNVASLPKGDYIENYRSRIWVGQKTTDKLYYSDIVTTSQTLTGGTSFIQISPQDGEQLTALARHPRALLAFKNNHIYRIFSISSIDPDPAIDRGTYSQESVIQSKSGIYYHHPTGFYKFIFEGEQQEISRPIIDIIKAIPRSYYPNISGWYDDDHLYWSIGDITLEGLSLSNIVCRYTISTQIWSLYSYGSEIRSSALYDDGTNLIPVVGDDNGNVLKLNSGNDDNGTEIHYDFITHWNYITNIKSIHKNLQEISAIHENAQGANIEYQVDVDETNKWTPIGKIEKELSHEYNINALRFKRIRFRLSGNSSGNHFIFRTFELLASGIEDIKYA